MNKTDYTKGKWERRGTFVYALNAEGHNRFDLNVQATSETPRGELEANACLIAASPRMVEFIQQLANKGNQEAKDFIQTKDTTFLNAAAAPEMYEALQTINTIEDMKRLALLLSCAEARNQAKADLETALADILKVCLALFWSETDTALVKLWEAWEAADLKRRKNTDARFLEEFR